MRKKKGGKEPFISNIIGNPPGKFIPDNIRREVELGHKEALIKKYADRKNDADANYRIVNDNYQEAEKNLEVARDREAKWTRIRIIIFNKIYYFFKDSLAALWVVGIAFANFFGQVLNNFMTAIKELKKTVLESKGAVLRALIFILFVFFLIYGFVMLSGSGSGKRNNKAFLDKLTSQTFIQSMQDSPFSVLSDQFYNLMPAGLQQRFTNLRNTISNFFGNDIQASSINSYQREVITEGRYDGLIHIKDNKDNNYIYTIVKPNNLAWNLNIDNYSDTDYSRLPTNLKEKYFNKQLYESSLEVENNNNGKYQFKLDYVDYIIISFYNKIYGNYINNRFIYNAYLKAIPKIDDTHVKKLLELNDKNIFYPILYENKENKENSYKDFPENKKNALINAINLFADDIKRILTKPEDNTNYNSIIDDYNASENNTNFYHSKINEYLTKIDNEKETFLIDEILKKRFSSKINDDNIKDYKNNLLKFMGMLSQLKFKPIPKSIFIKESSSSYSLNNIPVEDFLFSDKDNINPAILKEKLFDYNNNKYEYPMNYINNKIK